MSFFDDEAVEEFSDSDGLLVANSRPASLRSSSDEPRPSKRRRLNGVPSSQDSSDASIHDDHDLPQINHNDDDTASEDDLQGQAKSKYLMHVPEHAKPYENTFVTQVEQPASSPARIRGPRWQKKISSPIPSLSVPRQNLKSRTGADPTANEFDDDDSALMEAFLSSPVADFDSQRGATPSPANSSERHRSQPLHKSSSFRQTTLFGTVSNPEEVRPSQSRTHKWPLANRIEPLTHHKLDYEALATWVYPTNIGTIRDYQYNIVHRGLCHNLLVALPTGLGKTFIAATIMLNWFRWTKDAQIMFMAPTKPLVAQQIDACFNIAGIPRSQTSLLDGRVPAALRAQEYESKRVFFMTPQILDNDLKSGICDPKRVVLVVVDEAHHAKGAYAYVQVVKFLKRFNTSFRVLALTATPGSTVESVQNVIDDLDIARVEIRTEESIDIREYVYTRNIEQVVLEDSDEMIMAIELFSSAVRPVMDKLSSQNAYYKKDPASITLYGLHTAREQWAKTAGREAGMAVKGMVNSVFTVLMKLAQPLEMLKFHGIRPFYHKLKAFEEEAHSGKGGNAKSIVTNEHFKKLMNRMKSWINNADFEGHPKLSYLKTVVLNHFIAAEEGRSAAGDQSHSETRIMIFAHYRASAEDITRFLNRHQPIVRAHVFVGQAASKNSEGMDQKKQRTIVDEFKKGTYNVLVATSIGEEGLDIGEIDLIICYDASKSPIRMLQRMGRTGRKKAGNIVLLLMKGKEQNDFAAAQDNYQKIQDMIADGRRFTFREDQSPRIVPKEITPVVEKRKVDIPIENTQTELPVPRKGQGKKAKRPPKRFNMPDGVETGFAFLGDAQRSKADTKAITRISKSELDKGLAALPALDQVLLTPDNEILLVERYAQVSGTEPQYIQVPRSDAFPDELGKLNRSVNVPHSSMTIQIAKAYQAMREPDRDWTRPSGSATELLRISEREESGNEAAPGRPRRAKATPKEIPHRAESAMIRSSETMMGEDNDYDDNDSFIDDDGQNLILHEGEPSEDDLELEESRIRLPAEAPQPFYVSQKSVPDDEDLDEILPDFSDIVEETKRSSTKHISIATISARQRKKVTRVIDEEDDDF